MENELEFTPEFLAHVAGKRKWNVISRKHNLYLGCITFSAATEEFVYAPIIPAGLAFSHSQLSEITNYLVKQNIEWMKEVDDRPSSNLA